MKRMIDAWSEKGTHRQFCCDRVDEILVGYNAFLYFVEIN